MPVESPSVRFSIHFDGPITRNHLVSLRVMTKTYECMQRSIDRAYLIDKYGAVWKHARLSRDDYEEIDFLAAYPREGGIYIDAIRDLSGAAARALDRIASAIREPYERATQSGFDEAGGFFRQWEEMSQRADAGDVRFVADAVDEFGASWSRQYSSRAMLKEIDVLVSQISTRHYAGSTVDLGVYGEYARDVFQFDEERARRFHSEIGRRSLGIPIVLPIRVRSLDRGNRTTRPSGKVVNVFSGREANLHIRSLDDFEQLRPALNGEQFNAIVCPLLENGGYDPMGGDIVFVALAR